MFLKIKDKMIKYNLLGENKDEVWCMMGGGPDEVTGETWCYVLETSWLKKTLLFIEFEEGKASYLSSRVIYKNPLARSTTKYINRESAQEI